LSVEATAAALGCSTGTVKSQSSRALARLRALLGDGFTEADAAADVAAGTVTDSEHWEISHGN
jgi:DNA-directed RNA polymerase specialized sigma24 family protein